MQINMDERLSEALRLRMAKEYGETAQANFLLDIIGESLLAENKALVERNNDLVAANTRLNEELRVCRAELQEHQKREQERVNRKAPKAA